jgi:hypothetical protein
MKRAGAVEWDRADLLLGDASLAEERNPQAVAGRPMNLRAMISSLVRQNRNVWIGKIAHQAVEYGNPNSPFRLANPPSDKYTSSDPGLANRSLQ